MRVLDPPFSRAPARGRRLTQRSALYRSDVTQAGLRPHELRAVRAVSDEAGISHLLQSVLRGLDEQGSLSEYAGSVRGVATAVQRAQVVLDSFAESGQPYVGVVQDLVMYAGHVVQHLSRQVPSVVLKDMAAILSSAEQRVCTKHDQQVSRQIARALAELLTNNVLRELAEDILGVASKTQSPPALQSLAQHLSAIVGLHGRSAEALRADFDSYSQGASDKKALAACLLPIPRRFVVACVVDGAAGLEGVGDLLPGAGCWSLRGAAEERARAASDVVSPNWGKATKRFSDYLSNFAPSRAACVVVLPLEAHDKASAGLAARRAVQGVLDFYSAGRASSDLSVDTRILVGHQQTGDTIELQDRLAGLRLAYPLTHKWPSALRPALHAAHTAQTTATPIVKAAFAWIALEAAGLAKDEHVQALAKATALHALRYELIGAFQAVSFGIDALEDNARLSERQDREALQRKERGLKRCPDHLTDRRAELAVDIAALKLRLQGSEEALQRVEACLEDLRTLKRHVPTDKYQQVRNLNTWADLLSLPPASTEPGLGRLEPALPALSRHLVAQVRGLLQRSDLSLTVLEERRQDRAGLLTALKAARNQALHTGANEMRGDVLLGRAGSGVVGELFEILAHWYGSASGADARMPATEVVEHLAKRYEASVTHLTNGGSPLELSFDLLTSPLSSGFDEVGGVLTVTPRTRSRTAPPQSGPRKHDSL